jgi:esterase
VKLAYRESGSGQALVILHGLFGQSDNWFSLSKKFSENHLHVLAVDQRNHGLSPHSSEMNYRLMADDCLELLDHLKLEKPLLLGHSMGAKTLMYFEAMYPGRASGLVLVDMPPSQTPSRHTGIIRSLKNVPLTLITERKQAEAILAEDIHDLGTRQFLMKNLTREDEVFTWRFNLSGIADNYESLNAAVPDFHSNTPALVIRGGKSDYISRDDEEQFKKIFADCEIVTIPNSGHWVHAEAPQEFFDVVLGFIQRAG